MWSIGDMKKRGWSWMRHIFGGAYLACLIGFVVNGLSTEQMNPLLAAMSPHSGEHMLNHLPAMGPIQHIAMLLSFSAIALFLILAALLLKYFVLNPLEVGLCRYYLKSRETGTDAGVGFVFSVFSGGGYLNVVKTLCLRDIYLFFWTLLLIIPGIYKGLEYRMIPWLLAEYPEMESREAFAQTKKLMAGNRFKGFLLDLSFIGWNILAVIAGSLLGNIVGAVLLPAAGNLGSTLILWLEGMILLLVSPYEGSAWTELYMYLNHQPEVFDGNGDRIY